MMNASTELEFQAGLDAEPRNHAARLVFADWLDECGDERGVGYRAMGLLEWHAEAVPMHGDDLIPYALAGYWFWWAEFPWFDALPVEDTDAGDSGGDRRYYLTRQRAEDAAARAFARLSPERRAEILASGGVA